MPEDQKLNISVHIKPFSKIFDELLSGGTFDFVINILFTDALNFLDRFMSDKRFIFRNNNFLKFNPEVIQPEIPLISNEIK